MAAKNGEQAAVNLLSIDELANLRRNFDESSAARADMQVFEGLAHFGFS